MMVLDMLPVLNGEKNKLEFEFSKVLEKDSIICETFSDVDFFEPISVRGYVKNMAGYMYLHCDVSFKYSTACARCAEPVTNELAFSFEKDIASGDVSRDNDDYIFIEDKKLDVYEPMADQLMLDMPSKVLCREDCAGLCPTCGKNLNLGECKCEKSTGDPRLAILKTLLK